MAYKIAFSRMATGKLPQGDPRWGEFTTSFVNHELEVVDIANYIYLGHAYCAWLKGDRRNSENFQLAQHIAIDLDTEDERSTMDYLLRHPIVRMYGGIIHTSPSHTPDKPRARVIFFLDQPITDGARYSRAYTTVASLFNGADPVCKDPARFFYGAIECDWIPLMQELPLAHIARFYNQMPNRQIKSNKLGAIPGIVKLDDYRQRDTTTTSGEGLIDRLVREMQGAHEGSRNDTLNRVAFLAGKMAEKGEVDGRAVEMELKAAARTQGLDQTEIIKTFNSGFNAGRKAVG